MLSLPKHLYRTVARAWAMRPRCFGKLSMTVFWLFGFRLASAQQQPAPRVYTYVEQMPQLPGGGGQQRIVMELMKRFSYPVFNHSDHWPESNIKVSFIVNTDGSLQDVKLLASSRNIFIDNALLAAAYAMPCLLPGYQSSQPVRVQLTFPITLEYR